MGVEEIWVHTVRLHMGKSVTLFVATTEDCCETCLKFFLRLLWHLVLDFVAWLHFGNWRSLLLHSDEFCNFRCLTDLRIVGVVVQTCAVIRVSWALGSTLFSRGSVALLSASLNLGISIEGVVVGCIGTHVVFVWWITFIFENLVFCIRRGLRLLILTEMLRLSSLSLTLEEFVNGELFVGKLTGTVVWLWWSCRHISLLPGQLLLSSLLLLCSEPLSKLSTALHIEFGWCRFLLDNASFFLLKEHLDLLLIASYQHHIVESHLFFLLEYSYFDTFGLRSNHRLTAGLDDWPHGDELSDARTDATWACTLDGERTILGSGSGWDSHRNTIDIWSSRLVCRSWLLGILLGQCLSVVFIDFRTEWFVES